MELENRMLKCVKCDTKTLDFYNHKYSIMDIRHKFITSRIYAFDVPTCKSCRHEFKIWGWYRNILRLSYLINFLILVLGISFLLLFGLIFFEKNNLIFGVNLTIIGLIILIFNIIFRTLIFKMKSNPNNYIKWKRKNNILLVRPATTKNWTPYQIWIESTVREREYSLMAKKKRNLTENH